jgi:hypothetical protein
LKLQELNLKPSWFKYSIFISHFHIFIFSHFHISTFSYFHILIFSYSHILIFSYSHILHHLSLPYKLFLIDISPILIPHKQEPYWRFKLYNIQGSSFWGCTFPPGKSNIQKRGESSFEFSHFL